MAPDRAGQRTRLIFFIFAAIEFPLFGNDKRTVCSPILSAVILVRNEPLTRSVHSLSIEA